MTINGIDPYITHRSMFRFSGFGVFYFEAGRASNLCLYSVSLVCIP